MKKLLLIFCLIIFFAINSYSSEKITWQPVGLGGGGGMFTPAISPHNSELMFVSCDMGGLYKSTNAGKSWELLNFRSMSSSNTLTTVFHCTQGNILWDESGYSLMMSEDTGKSWSKVWEFPADMIDMVCMRTEPLTLILLASEGTVYTSNDGINFIDNAVCPAAMYLAENGTEVWAASSNQVWISSDRAFSFSEIDIDELDIQSEIMSIAATENEVFVLQKSQLLRSKDKGESWEVLIKSLDYDRGDFRFVRAEGNYVWVTTSGGGKYQTTAFLSEDNGNSFAPVFFCNSSWDDISNNTGDWLSLDFNCGWGGPALGFCISKQNPSTALWTDAGRCLATFDSGNSWSPLFTQFADSGFVAAGKKWESVGLEVTSCWNTFIDPLDSNHIHCAYTDIGGKYSFDRGKTWKSTANSGIPSNWFNTNYDLELDSANGILWGGFSQVHDIPGGWSFNTWNRTGDGGICYSTDYGISWTAVESGGIIEKPVTSIAVDYSSDKESRRIYAALWSNGIWKSEDGGKTWSRASIGLDCGDGESTNDGPNTHILEVKVAQDGTLYALKTKYIRNGSKIKNDGGLWKSTDYGENWTCISSNVKDCPPNSSIDLDGEHSWADPISFELDELNNNHIFVCAQNCNNGKVQGGLYETYDAGANWNRIFQTYCAFRLIKSKYYTNRYYLATSDGIYISDDNCMTWLADTAFPFPNVTRITEDIHNKSILWVNTFGGGTWKGEIVHKINSVNKTPFYKSIDIFPNPASDFIDISFERCPTLSKCLTSAVDEIKIFNAFGEIVGAKLALPLQALPLQALPLQALPLQALPLQRINISHLHAGLYFIQIGNYVEKFVVVR